MFVPLDVHCACINASPAVIPKRSIGRGCCKQFFKGEGQRGKLDKMAGRKYFFFWGGDLKKTKLGGDVANSFFFGGGDLTKCGWGPIFFGGDLKKTKWGVQRIGGGGGVRGTLDKMWMVRWSQFFFWGGGFLRRPHVGGVKNFFRGGVLMLERGKEDIKCGKGVQSFFGGGDKEDELWGRGYKEFFVSSTIIICVNYWLP